MKKRSLPFTLFVLGLSGVLPVLAGCPKEQPAPVIFDAAPPPPVESTAPVDLMPLEDAGLEEEDADADAAPKKAGVNVNVARVRQCCNAISALAKGLGASPEAGILNGAAASCNVAASQLSPNSTGAELAPVRAMIKQSGKAIPGVCSGI